MTATAIIGAITALAKAFPAIETLVSQVMAGVIQQQYKTWQANNQKAVLDAITSQNQTGLESQIGNSNAGGVSNDPNTTIVSSLPGVK